jgi:glycosyltransferase involved in cell wall biosynthesis
VAGQRFLYLEYALKTTIFINGRFLSRQPTGVDRVGYELVCALDRLVSAGDTGACRYDWVLVLPPNAIRVPQLANIRVVQAGRFKGNLWEQIDLPWLSRSGFLVNFCNTAPLFKRNSAVMIHDTATMRVPQSYSVSFRAWYRVLTWWSMHMARMVLTVSDFSRNELRTLFVDRDIVLMPQGADHFERIVADETILVEQKLGDRPFVLAVGSQAPHKNFGTLIKAMGLMGEAEFDLVIAGGTNPRIFMSEAQALPNWVRYVGFVTDQQLKALYSRAAAFVFPSVYEGYGLPPVEAMANGCPVICSRSAAIPEACGEAAVYFDATDAANMAFVIKQTLSDGAKLRALSVAGHDRVSALTWNNAALKLCFELNRFQV